MFGEAENFISEAANAMSGGVAMIFAALVLIGLQEKYKQRRARMSFKIIHSLSRLYSNIVRAFLIFSEDYLRYLNPHLGMEEGEKREEKDGD